MEWQPYLELLGAHLVCFFCFFYRNKSKSEQKNLWDTFGFWLSHCLPRRHHSLHTGCILQRLGSHLSNTSLLTPLGRLVDPLQHWKMTRLLLDCEAIEAKSRWNWVLRDPSNLTFDREKCVVQRPSSSSWQDVEESRPKFCKLVPALQGWNVHLL